MSFAQNMRYPIGQQNFSIIRERNEVYIDKTGFIPLLLENQFYFLSRPRRFGKSLFLSTLECFFRGKRELFKGLAIESFDWNWECHPVIRIDFTGENYNSPQGLKARIVYILNSVARNYGVTLPSYSTIAECLRHLISALHEKSGKRVVVLIDEYEKALLDVIDYPDQLDKNKEELSAFYSVFKSESEHIRFLFITGITRFGHLNIFSGLNNLKDISLSEKFSAICGITEEEIMNFLLPGVKELAESKNTSTEEAFNLLKLNYDGYHFSSDLKDVYNPFSLLNCLYDKKFTSEWFVSGSASYLLRQLKKNNFDISQLEGVKVSASTLQGVDVELMDPVTLLYQSGYFTIKKFDEKRDRYEVGIPNREVKEALFSVIIPFYLGKKESSAKEFAFDFLDYLEEGEIEKAMTWLKGFFSSIPYDVKLNYEVDFQYLIYCFFALVNLLGNTTLEKQTSDGRIDLTLILNDFVYIFEFKIGESAQQALEQIRCKGYASQWEDGTRKVIKIGVAFSAEKRGITAFQIEK